MFDNGDGDDDAEYFEGDLSDDLKKFEALMNGEAYGFIDSDRWEALIDHFMINGQFKNALICIDEALISFSFNSIFSLRKAQCFSTTGKLKEAINLISELEKKGEHSFEIILTKASVFSQLKDTKNAIRFFLEALSIAEKDHKDELYLDLAIEYENSGDYQSALKVLKDAIKFNPNNETAIYEIAFCYDQLGDYKSSIKCYSDFIDENPYSFTSWYNLGNAYAKVEDFEKSIWAYDYCILINEDFGPVFFNLANSFLSLGKYTKAIESFHKCVEMDGDDPIAFCYIGECHEQLNELDLARHFYNKSIDLAPLLPDAHLGLGIILDLEGKTREGLPFIQKALELDPENAGIYHVLAGAHEKLEEYIEASDFYELSLAIDPNDEECLTNYVALLSEDSLVSVYDFLFEFPENAISEILRVIVLWKMDKKIESLELFRKCIKKDKEKALELFEINQEFKSIREFKDLSE